MRVYTEKVIGFVMTNFLRELAADSFSEMGISFNLERRRKWKISANIYKTITVTV